MLARSVSSSLRPARPHASIMGFSSKAPICRLNRRFNLLRSSDEDEAATAAEPSGFLLEVNKDNFWEYMKAEEQRDVLVVVDCYTEWCGPCKMIYPDLVKLSEELEPKARIVKFNCNKANKDLGVELKIKVAPTFLLFRNAEKVGEMTGAKLLKLKSLINEKLDPVAASS